VLINIEKSVILAFNDTLWIFSRTEKIGRESRDFCYKEVKVKQQMAELLSFFLL
jgi:hypothetical protein